jgi:FixJ family two-component response regulator
VTVRRVVGVIDDDPSVRRALLRLFRTAGLETFLFATAEEYLSSPDRAGIAFLVIDVRLPGMGGLELQKQLRAETSTPALFMTAHEDEQARSRALAGGAVGFFLKPFDNRQLLDVILAALGDERHQPK